MREIKFRAWHHNKSIMFNVVHLEVYLGNIHVTDGANEDNCIMGYIGDTKLSLMQYTGLKDKNGVEIYEGDILKIDDPEDNSMFSVYFEKGAFRKKYKQFPEGTIYPSLHDSMLNTWWEVIGNIYENPDLLNPND